MNGTGNYTMKLPESRFELVYHTVLLVMAVLIITINTLVIALFKRNRTLRSPGNFFLVSLAVSDLAVGLLGIPMSISCELLLNWASCLSAYSINRFIAVSTVYHILWITLEKYYAIVYPFQHKSKFDRRSVIAAILSIWFGSLLVTSVELIWLAGHGDPKKAFSSDMARKQLIYNGLMFITCLLLPVTLMVYAYWSIFRRILRSRRFTNDRNSQEATADARLSYKIKPALLFLGLLLIFVVCWFWWFFVQIFQIFESYGLANSKTLRSPKFFEQFLVAFRFSTSFANPMLYTFFKRDFYICLRKLVTPGRLTPAEQVNYTYYRRKTIPTQSSSVQ